MQTGLWELYNFDPLIVHMKAMYKNTSREFAGALLRPHGSALSYMQREGLPVADIIEAAKEAGRQLVRNGQVSSKTLKTISRELLPLEMYVQEVNKGFTKALESLKE